ncbi:tail fiber domain-containing protein [Ochrobactrum sp. MYb379]|uniref:tail fiber domain-containing protein n=1 Tax=Ochrobactrum sp. MYb379 TaxID=2745275 RepID=UPI0030AC689C
MGKSKAPKAPDPKETSAAQTGTNIGTAVANSWLNNVNQVTPDGSLTYTQTGTKNYYDPYTGKSYEIPLTTATQTLSPQQQAIKDQEDATNLNLGKLANSQSSRLNDLLGKPFTLDGAPAGGNAANLKAPNYQQYGGGPQLQTSVGAENIQNKISDAGKIQTGIGNAGDITRSYGGDYSGNVQQVQDALMSRLNPQIEQDRSALSQRLANQGIMPGSAAHQTAMDQMERNVNDQRTSVLLASGQEQSRLAGLDQAQAQFQNSAQQQSYNQLLGSGQFANAAQAQQYGQNANNAQFGNSAQQQGYEQAMGNANLGNSSKQQMWQNQNQTTQNNNALAGQKYADQQTQFNAQNTQRNQYLQEQYQQRNQPINEISALLSGAQVTNPNFVNSANSQIATTDVAGLINQNYQNQLGAWQQQQQQAGGILGGLFGLGSKLIGLSDASTKENIRRVGSLDNGLPIYAYNYKGDSMTHIGLIAQEVEEVNPEAVHRIGSVRVVNYEKAVEAA